MFISRHRSITALVALLAVVVLSPAGLAQAQLSRGAYIREHYTKREYQIPMRDGVKLFTTVYAPKDQSREYPFLMKRTPYSVSPYGEDRLTSRLGPSEELEQSGYIFVLQDVRGCYMSEGEFVNMTPHIAHKRGPTDVDESSDTYDTIEWLLGNIPNNNRRVGMWGISYPGFYAAASMIDAHPALKASSPQAPVSDWWFDDFHHHGAFFLPHAFGFLSGFGLPREGPSTQRARRDFEWWTPDGYEFYMDMGPLRNANEKYLKHRVEFWDEIIAHPNYDEFWQQRNIIPHLQNVAPAVMTVGGWYDAEDLYGPLNIYQFVEEANPDIFNMLVMGPWVHGGWARSTGESVGNIHFGSQPSPFYRANIEAPFFEYFLKGEGEMTLPEAYVFEVGTNQWRTFDDWPPGKTQVKWLHPQDRGGLSFEASQIEGYDEYESDPAKPVPFTEAIARGMTREYMTDDQRFASRRPDVVTYQTDVLEADVTLAGPVLADLWVSTSGTASDWIVKLIDVFPGDHPDTEATADNRRMGGYQMMVRSEVMRGRFRNSYEHPQPFVSGEPTNVRVPLQDVLHTFKEGHRIMIQIQSTWFPLVDRNPQKYVDNIYLAEEADFIKATQRVYFGGENGTRIGVGVLPAKND